MKNARLLRISTLHIFDLYMFRCCLFTQATRAWLDVTDVKRQGQSVTLSFERYAVKDRVDCYSIVDDEGQLVAERILETPYMQGLTLHLTFEVTHDSDSESV